MKKVVIPVCLAAFVNLVVSCGGNESSDSTSDTSSTSSATTTDTSMMATDTGMNANMASADTSSNDSKFVLDAASGGLMEVELGTMASKTAASAKVKQFGQMMVTDHTKANTQLKAIAAKKNITVPTTPAEEQQHHIDDMKGKTGADFDQAYVDMMVDDHKEDIQKFQDEVQNGKDSDVKAFAAKTLPVLQKHLTSIQAIQATMKK